MVGETFEIKSSEKAKIASESSTIVDENFEMNSSQMAKIAFFEINSSEIASKLSTMVGEFLKLIRLK